MKKMLIKNYWFFIRKSFYFFTGILLLLLSPHVYSEVKIIQIVASGGTPSVLIESSPELNNGDKLVLSINGVIAFEALTEGNIGISQIKILNTRLSVNPIGNEVKVIVTRGSGGTEKDIQTVRPHIGFSYENLKSGQTGTRYKLMARKTKILVIFEDNNMPLQGYINNMDVKTDFGTIKTKLTPLVGPEGFWFKANKSQDNVSVSVVTTDQKYVLK